jgi:hypothetical protein
MVVHTYNPNYLGCGGRRISNSRPSWTKASSVSKTIKIKELGA